LQCGQHAQRRHQLGVVHRLVRGPAGR
jgi:hypothetical protein